MKIVVHYIHYQDGDKQQAIKVQYGDHQVVFEPASQQAWVLPQRLRIEQGDTWIKIAIHEWLIGQEAIEHAK